jgi:hypothetical protein
MMGRMSRRKLGDVPPPVSEAPSVAVPGDVRVRWTVEDALDASVVAALERLFGSYDGDLSGVRRVLRLEFQGLLRTSGRSVRTLLRRSFLTELHRSHLELVLARERAKEELARLEEWRVEFGGTPPVALEPETGSAPAQAPHHVVPTPELDRALLEERFRAVLARSTLSPKEQQSIAAEFGKEAETALERALESFRLRRDHSMQEEMDRYERRIAKLKESLERTEQLLSDLAGARLTDPGVASIYRDVQGLQADVRNREQKAALLADIFEANLALRSDIQKLGSG